MIQHFCGCGCGQQTNLATRNNSRLGHVVGIPYRFLAGHQNKDLAISQNQRMPTAGWVRHKYRLVYNENRKRVQEHRYVWEKTFGQIPIGYQIHYKNGDTKDNSLSNLMILNSIDHKRLHSGCILLNGKWMKKCIGCGNFKSIESDYYLINGRWPLQRCKECHRHYVSSYQKARRKRYVI